MNTGRTGDRSAVVRPFGRITVANAEDFRKELQSHVDRGDVHLTIDLANVNTIDSKGLAILIICHRTVTSLGGSLTVVTDDEDLRRLFRVMRFDQHFTVRGSKDPAATTPIAAP